MFFTSPGSATSGCGCSSRPELSDSAALEGDEDERIEIVPWPLGKLDEAIAACEDSKTLIALLWLARARSRS